MNRHGVAMVDFNCPVVICCLFGPIHAQGGILDLLMTDVAHPVRVAVLVPLGNSDH